MAVADDQGRTRRDERKYKSGKMAVFHSLVNWMETCGHDDRKEK